MCQAWCVGRAPLSGATLKARQCRAVVSLFVGVMVPFSGAGALVC
jgi:hypothetical protein